MFFDKNKKLPVIFLLILFIAGVFLFSFFHREEKKLPEVTRRFPVMGTICSFRLAGNSSMTEEELQKAAQEVQNTFFQIEKMCNIFDEKSELSILNSKMSRSPVQCSGSLWELLQEARFFHQYSSGAFDVTIRPLMLLWGFHRKKASLPAESRIKETKNDIGLSRILFDEKNHSVFAPPPGKPQFDLGGIAKGYALDKAARTAAEYGIKRGLLDLGGNLRSLELPPQKNKPCHRIGIRDPEGGDFSVETIELPNGMSIATSGNYERYVRIGGVRYTHILDARTGYPVSGILSATVLTGKAVHSDALSTCVFILGEEFAEKVHKEFPDTSILIFREEKGKLIRKGWGRFAR